MAPKLISPQDLLRNVNGNVICLYGGPGVGKTTLASTANNPFIISVDPGGAVPLLGKPGLDKRIALCSSMDDVEEAFDYVIADKYKGDDIFLDTATVLQKTDSYNERLRMTTAKPERRMKPSENEWSDLNRRLIDLMLKWLMARPGKNLTVICHQRIERNDAGTIIGYTPDVLPQSLNAFLQFFSGVFYYSARRSQGTTSRVLVTRPGQSVALTKSRWGIPELYTNPTWSQVTTDIMDWYKKHE